MFIISSASLEHNWTTTGIILNAAHYIIAFYAITYYVPVRSQSYYDGLAFNHQNLVLHGDISEEMTHTLFVVNPSDGLSQEDADVDSLDLVGLGLLSVVRDTVGHYHLVNTALVDQDGRLLGENPVGGHAVDLAGAIVLQDLGCFHEAVDVIHNIIHHDGYLPVHLPN